MSSLFDDHVRTQRERTDAALATCGFDALAIHAGSHHMRFLDDQPYPFQANPHFKLWAPLADCADCWILYRPGQALRMLFLQPLDYWHKPPAMPEGHWIKHFEFEVIRTAAQAKDLLADAKNCAFIGEWRTEFGDWGFAAANPEALLCQLHHPRAIKTPYELECMREASRSAACGHRAAEAAFRAGRSEYEIHMAYLQAIGHTDEELPYPSIVALDAHAAVLHYQHRERQRPHPARSFLLDAGAQIHGYASDVTRTYAREQNDFATLIESMHALQLALCTQVRPGMDYVDIHLDMHLRIAGLLREAGVIGPSATEAVERGLSSVFVPHGIGHLLGLQVHDVAGWQVSSDGRQKPPPASHPYLRLTRRLEPGFVVTIEPGLYFIDLLLEEARASTLGRDIDWRRVAQLKPFGGIRIEDNVACTRGDPENLTRSAFDWATAGH